MNEIKTRLTLSFILLFSIMAVGTTGYIVIEGWTFLDALYMTIITLTTVGYREVHELSTRGIIFTIGLLVTGTGTALVVLGTGASLILEGKLQEFMGRKRLEKRVRDLHGHYIICGYGRMGRIISRELRQKKAKFVIVEKDQASCQSDAAELVLFGDATSDHVLNEAGIQKASGLISVLPTDAENLFVVLSARGLNPKLFIVARAVEEGSEKKLIRAGADKVVSPYHIGGLRIAYTILKPAVVEFIEFATKTGNIELQLEEIIMEKDSPFIGKSLDECGIGRELGVIIVAVKRNTGDMKFNPTSKTLIREGDTLIAIGEVSRLELLEKMAGAVKKNRTL